MVDNGGDETESTIMAAPGTSRGLEGSARRIRFSLAPTSSTALELPEVCPSFGTGLFRGRRATRARSCLTEIKGIAGLSILG